MMDGSTPETQATVVCRGLLLRYPGTRQGDGSHRHKVIVRCRRKKERRRIWTLACRYAHGYTIYIDHGNDGYFTLTLVTGNVTQYEEEVRRAEKAKKLRLTKMFYLETRRREILSSGQSPSDIAQGLVDLAVAADAVYAT